MKKLLAITLLILSTLFFASCVEDDDDWEDTEYSGDTQHSGDTTPSDPTDTGSADTGDTGDTTPAPVSCTGFSIDPKIKYVKEDELSDTYYADITDVLGSTMEDKLKIEFFVDDPAVTSYDLSIPYNQQNQSCKQCVSVFQDIKSDGTPTKRFFQESGTLTIDQIDNSHGIKGSLTAKLVEVTVDNEGESTPVSYGACFEIESVLFDNVCVPDCEGKICGGDGCGGTCGENNGECEGENMACSADQTKCEKYECAQVSVNSLYTTSTSNEKLYYSASYNQTVGSETTTGKETFNLKIRSLSMKKETDLASMSFINNCDATVGGSPVPGQPELSSVCMSVQDKSDGNRFYFPKQGTINITTLESNGNLNAELSGVRLVEIDTSNGIAKAGGKCIDITNTALSYTAQ